MGKIVSIPASQIGWGVWTGFLVFLWGCGESKIQHYRVPKTVPVEVAQAVVKTSPERLLVAMLKSDNQFWFFKLTGMNNVIETGKDEFLQFIQSVRFGPQADSIEPKISWTVPPGWISLPASGMRYATFQVPVHESRLELTVTPLGPEAGALLPNVNRWREQLGLSPVQESELPMFTKTFEVDGRPVTLVDIMSTPPREVVSEKSGPMPTDKVHGKLLTYTLPDGWVEDLRVNPMRIVAFQIKEQDEEAEVTVVSFPGAAGGIVSNINRWRQQVGLEMLSEEALRQELRPMEISGVPGHYVDLKGPESGGKSKRILGVVVPRQEETWFFKMTGSSGLLSRHSTKFAAFVQSVQFL